MAETVHDKPVPVRQVKPRAWWQWLLGAVLLLGAVGLMAVRYLPRQPSAWLQLAGPREIRVPSELKPADALPARPGDLSGVNVLLVTLDTTRADRIGCYGNDRIQTPTLDGLARGGALFSHALAPGPVTLPSHASILTGLYPYRHGARSNGFFRLSDEHGTLAEILAAQGYQTAAFTSAFVLDARFGLAQGFAHYDDDMGDDAPPAIFRAPDRKADETTARAAAWLRAAKVDQPFFLWVHYFDPHAPYKPPATYVQQYPDDPYSGEIAFVDDQLGELLAVVQERGLTDKTLVIATADHGEGMNQHDEWTHGCLLYDATLRVPLIMRCGGRLGGGIHVNRPVSLVDILPTVLSLLGLEAPPQLDGLNLLRPAPKNRAMFMETLEGWMDYGFAPLLAVRAGMLKYIHGPDPELYDLAADPFEEKNMLKQNAAAADQLKARLTELYGPDLAAATWAQPSYQMSAEEAAKLGAIGYLGSGAPPATAELPDPKTMMSLKREVEGSVQMDPPASPEQLVTTLGKFARQHPDVYMVHWYYCDALKRKGDLPGAAAALQRCLELRPKLPHALLAMARLKTLQNDADSALSFYQEVLDIAPQNFAAHYESGLLLLDRGQMDEALAKLSRALQFKPQDSQIVDALVLASQTAGRTDSAISLLQESLKAQANLPAVRNSLGQLLVQKQRFADAIAVLKEGIELAPEQLELQSNLAFLLATCPQNELRKPYEAAQLAERICQRTDYKRPEYLHTLAVVYGSLYRWDEAITLAEKARDLAKAEENTRVAESAERTLAFFRQSKEKGVSPMLKGAPPPTSAPSGGSPPGSGP